MRVNKNIIVKILAFSLIGYFVLYGMLDYAIDTWGTEDINKPFSKSHYTASYVVNITTDDYKDISMRGTANIQVKRDSLYKKKRIYLDEIYVDDEQWIPQTQCELILGKRVKCIITSYEWGNDDLGETIESVSVDENGNVEVEVNEEALNEYIESNKNNKESDEFEVLVELTSEKIE